MCLLGGRFMRRRVFPSLFEQIRRLCWVRNRGCQFVALLALQLSPPRRDRLRDFVGGVCPRKDGSFWHALSLDQEINASCGVAELQQRGERQVVLALLLCMDALAMIVVSSCTGPRRTCYDSKFFQACLVSYREEKQHQRPEVTSPFKALARQVKAPCCKRPVANRLPLGLRLASGT